MNFTVQQVASITEELKKIAIDNIKVVQYDNGDLHVEGTEITTLRLFAHYNFNGYKNSRFAKCGYSKNLGCFWFELRISEMYNS